MKSEVIEVTIHSLQFLVNDYHFKEPTIDERRHATMVQYTGSDFGVEAELDWHERIAVILITRLDNGEWPDGHYVDSVGRRCRIHLGAAIRRAGLQNDKSVPTPHGPPSDERMISEIQSLASQLERSIGTLTEKSHLLFTGAEGDG